MIRSDCGGGCDNSDSTTSPSVAANGIRNDKDHQAERVLQQPITIGDHFLDVAMESKIRAQGVLGELQRIEALVETLPRRIKEANYGGASASASFLRSGTKVSAAADSSRSSMSSSDELSGLTEAIHERLDTFLLRQLQAPEAEMGHLARQ